MDLSFAGTRRAADADADDIYFIATTNRWSTQRHSSDWSECTQCTVHLNTLALAVCVYERARLCHVMAAAMLQTQRRHPKRTNMESPGKKRGERCLEDWPR